MMTLTELEFETIRDACSGFWDVEGHKDKTVVLMEAASSIATIETTLVMARDRYCKSKEPAATGSMQGDDLFDKQI